MSGYEVSGAMRVERIGTRAAAAATLAFLMGCASIDDAPSDRGSRETAISRPSASFWPSRRTGDLDAVATALLAPPLDASEGVIGGRLGASERVVGAYPRGMGLVLAIREVNGAGELLAPEREPRYGFVSLPGTKESATGAARSLLADATRIAGYRILEPDGAEPSGIAVALGGPDPAEERCADSLAADLVESGFLVIRGAAPRIAGGDHHVEIATLEEAEAAAAALARAVDQGLAETAYGAEAMIAHVETRHASLAGAPVLLLGVGEGSLALAGIALRLERRLSIVWIGGEHDVLAAEERRPLEERRIRIVRRGAAGETDARRWFADVFRRECRLQPAAAAAWLRDAPLVLVVARDEDEEDELYDALNWPKRIRLGGDRESLLRYAALRDSLVLADAVRVCLPVTE
jgi:hypothetical protein